MYVSPQSVGIIHFIGIGGIGMSGIAEVLHGLGYFVRGSDIFENANVQRLRLLGIPIFIGHDAIHVQDAAVVVVSSDIKKDNIELQAARALSLPVVHRASMLAELMRLKPSIAVAGTHGKTSTTSLGAAVLEAGGLNPTVVSGGIINAYGTNARLGTGEWVIVEADESDGSFTRLPATIAIVTNIDREHMEHYGSFEALRQAFIGFIENLPFYGLGILCIDHPEVRSLIPQLVDRRIVTYGFSEEADVRAVNMALDGNGSTFDVMISSRFHMLCKNALPVQRLEKVHLSMLGAHNVQNALSTIAMALELGIESDKICRGLASFEGVGRRFTCIGQVCDLTIIDDYAHHPQEIRAVLNTARVVSGGQVIAVMQPHRYSRLETLYEDFCTCFEEADQVIISPIYSAREEPRPGLSHIKLAKDISFRKGKTCLPVENLEELASVILNISKPGDLVICMGAGNITQWAHALPQELIKASENKVKRTGTY
jgi:UDP-N-acetylmuramate--alanine ligase